MRIITFLLLLISASAFSKTALQTLKITDATSAYCRSQHDVQDHNNGGVYSGKATKAALSKGQIQFTIELKFLACKKTEDDFRFIYRKPYARFEYLTPFTNEVVYGTPTAVHLRTYKDGIYEMLSNIRIDNNAIQDIKFTTSIKNLLSPYQLSQLENNIETYSNFDFSISKLIHYRLEGQGTSFTDIKNFGAFRVHFKIQKSDSGLKVNLL